MAPRTFSPFLWTIFLIFWEIIENDKKGYASVSTSRTLGGKKRKVGKVFITYDVVRL